MHINLEKPNLNNKFITSTWHLRFRIYFFPRLCNSLKYVINFCHLRTFAPIATAHLWCAHYSLGTGCHIMYFKHVQQVQTQQNIELMTFALTWCANIFVGCSVTPTFFFGRSLPFLILSVILKNKKICMWEVLIISHYTVHIRSNLCMDTTHFLRLILPDLMTSVTKIYQIGLYMLC